MISLALVAVSLAAAQPAGADTVGTIRGTVERDGAAAGGVSVHLAGDRIARDSVTDAGGRFAFARVPFGHYVLGADVATASARVEVDVAADSVVDVRLVALATIARTVTSTRSIRGTPVSENAIPAAAIASLPRNGSLNALIQTVPGVVRFSYNEPVAHGFHGLMFELDGAPLPQSTSANFSELVDPRSIETLEVFTGAFPAEFGGSRQGAVVNVRSKSPDPGGRSEGLFTSGLGNFGSAEAGLVERFAAGAARIALGLNASRTERGIDSPTFRPRHDAGNLSDEFLRVTVPAGARTDLTFNLTNQFAAFAIPINTILGPSNPLVSAPGTDDVQREYDRFASVSLAHTSKDGLGYVQILPWLRSTRTVYDGDLPRDVLGTFTANDGTVTPQNGLRQDRRATYLGLRASILRAGDRHALKTGIEVAREDFSSNVLIVIPGSPNFSDNVTRRGTTFGAYVEDKWRATRTLGINAGLRFDRSTGFVGGGQLSPRIEVNLAAGPSTILHAYFGRLYAAPALEDTRREAVITQTSPVAAPIYDLKPERDSYLELGVAHTFRPGLSGYVNAFNRTAVNVLDTTQLSNTPLFAVFNNAAGFARGVELRLVGEVPGRDRFFLSATFSHAAAGGVSGSTFLVPPDAAAGLTLQPEDHDQPVAIDAAYTRRWAPDKRTFATVQTEFGSGYPVAFQNGNARLPSHAIFNLSLGRDADKQTHSLGWSLAAENVFNKPYLIKVNNGFNTTQWGPGMRLGGRVMIPL